MRWFLLLAAFLSLSLSAVSAAAQTSTPRINPLTGKPYSAATQAEYERRQRENEELSRMAEEAAAADNKAFEEMRARDAEQIRKFDEAVETWKENATPPEGTRETFVSTSYDNDTALGERAEITYYNKYDVSTHKVQFGPDGKPTGPLTQTQQGKVWETVGPRIPPDGGVETSYGEDFEGNRIITRAQIFGPDGKNIGDYRFNFDGVPWWGETTDPETRLRSGGFMDERLKPPETTMGGPLAEPAQVRLITGVCDACRALGDEHNDLAARINAIVIEMKSLSAQHQRAWPPAQRPIRARHDALAAELAQLMPLFEALRVKVVECEKQCRAGEDTALEETLTARPDGPEPRDDGPPLSRPPLEHLPDLALPASFCSETERVRFMTEVYNPAAAAALSNARIAQDHQAKLNALFTETMRANSPHWAAVRAERDAFEPIGAETTVRAEALRQLYSAILAVPIVPCPEDTLRTATGPGAEEPPTEAVAVNSPTTTRARTPKEDCPPKQGRDPIIVGPNSKVGSGAQLRSKVGGMALGALAGALGAGGGGGGGRGSDGPQLWTCKIKDSEYTVFNDPVTGVSLGVAARSAKGGKMVLFSKIMKSPDRGTFQTAFLERPSTGQTIAPSDVGPCDLWGEWKLTVSWTRSTYVDGQLVSQESGGWSEGGLFRIPGMLSKVDAPDGLWKRMGFSNASNGAREMGAIFDVQPGGEPLTLVVHVTRPKGDPVTTVPFILSLTQGADGKIAVTKAKEEDCPEDEFAESGRPLTSPPPGDAPAESILDEIEEGPPGASTTMPSPGGGATPGGSESPESILDEIEESPPGLTGGTGVASDGATAPRTASPSPSKAPETSTTTPAPAGAGGTTTRPMPQPSLPPWGPGPKPYDPSTDPDFGKLHVTGLQRLVDGLEKFRAEDVVKRQELERARCEGTKAWNEKREAYLKGLRGRLDIVTRFVGLGKDKAAIESAATAEVVRLGAEIAEVEAMSPPGDSQSCPVTPVPEEGESILDEIEEVFVPS